MTDQERDEESLALVTAFFQIQEPFIRATLLELAHAAVRGAVFEVKIFEQAKVVTSPN